MRTLDDLADFVDTASIGLHWVAADGTILWANPADYEPLGYTAGEYIGRNITEFHADPSTIQDILRRLTNGERLLNYEARLRKKDGSLRDVQITSSVLFEDGPDGRRFVHTRCYTQDITERKRMDRARDRFVTILGHDLRNPLGAVAMAADYLVKAKDLSDYHRDVAARIARASARMAALVRDLIEVTRHLGGLNKTARRPEDFGAICKGIIDETQLAHPGVDIDLALIGNLSGNWDADRVAQAISNMLGNAVQHGEPPVRVLAQDAGDHIRLDVANGGNPIPAEALDGIFEPFTHAGDTEGLGLGLFIVSQVVKAHGGTISVRSTRAEGTVFSSTWPRSE
ncbi:MAG: PAS domain-containing sensor histidine kinase [Vicinamibacterales bacterium]